MLHVRQDVNKRDAEMLCCEQTYRIISPSRRQNDLCVSGLAELQQPCQQLLVDNVRKLARIVRSFAIENAIYIQKNYFHQNDTSGLRFARQPFSTLENGGPAHRQRRAPWAYLGSLSAISLWCLSAVTVLPAQLLRSALSPPFEYRAKRPTASLCA